MITAAVLVSYVSLTVMALAAQKPQQVILERSLLGPPFDGLGGVSAGTGPRLLIDYEEPTRSHILDLLFAPSFGASLQILKVEIGGTGDSTQGTEASHEPQKGVLIPDAGYELWLAREAKARNAEIKIYGLAWNFPAWIREGVQGSNFSANVAQYLVDWLSIAKTHHNVSVDIIGWQNEHTWQVQHVVDFRRLLDSSGFKDVSLAIADCGPGPGFQTPDISERIKENPELDKAAAIVGHHYPVSIMPVQANRSFYQSLWSLKQKLWASEEYSTYSDTNGARCLAKLFNRNYVDANLTASLVWDMLWSSFDGLACAGDGLMWAAEPWSGAYGALDSMWAAAHTTQFTHGSGWRYLAKPSGAGYLEKPEAPGYFYGSYVTLVSEDGKDITLVIETMDNDDSKCSYGNGGWTNITYPREDPERRSIEFCLSSCIPKMSLTLFATTIDSQGIGERFEKHAAVVLDGECCFAASLTRNSIQTFSTLSTARKGSFPEDTIARPPEGLSNGCGTFEAPAVTTPFPFPFSLNFSTWATAVRFQDFPMYLSDVEGVFRVSKERGVLSQGVLAPSSRGIPFGQEPTTVVGDKTWTDYTVTTQVQLPRDAPRFTYAAVYARFGNGFSFQSGGGYALKVSTTGAWNLTVRQANASETVLTGGTLPHPKSWMELTLTVEGRQVYAKIDGALVGHVTSDIWTHGLAGLGCGYHAADFFSFSVERNEIDTVSI